MPLFDFRCRACGHLFEALVRTGHAPACPSCQSQDLEKQPSTFAVSSAGSRAAAALKSRQKAAEIGRQESIVKEAEAKEHRDHDH